MSIRYITAGMAFMAVSSTSFAGFKEGIDAYAHGDFETAFSTFHPLAENGVSGAQYNLGLMYAYGQGVSQNYDEALKWYRRAAENGYRMAMHNIGDFYSVGKGVQQNYTEAGKWFRIAAENGYVPSQHNLGALYLHGKGVPQSFIEAYAWLSVAAATGNEDEIKVRDIVARTLTKANLKEGQKLAKEYLKKYPPRP
ncbi:MAG: sel1 repeat family protein [Rhodocyclaceae bacterium]|nr:MAG: sel1 repeat family protein [Rhodocyclaceae bacterium]